MLNAMTLVLTDGGFGRIMPDALWLLRRLALIGLVMEALWWGLSEDDVLVAFLAKMLWITAFIWLVTSWPWLTRVILTSFIQVGLRAGGGVLSVEDFSNPARIA